MKTVTTLLPIVLMTLFVTGPLARADIAIPTQTEVVFTSDGQLYRSEVTFSVECFGQMVWPANPPKEKIIGESKVFSFSGQCLKYPCYIDQGYNTNYRRIDFCNLTGFTKGRRFEVTHFSNRPFGNCEYTNGERNCRTEFALPKIEMENPPKR